MWRGFPRRDDDEDLVRFDDEDDAAIEHRLFEKNSWDFTIGCIDARASSSIRGSLDLNQIEESAFRISGGFFFDELKSCRSEEIEDCQLDTFCIFCGEAIRHKKISQHLEVCKAKHNLDIQRAWRRALTPESSRVTPTTNKFQTPVKKSRSLSSPLHSPTTFSPNTTPKSTSRKSFTPKIRSNNSTARSSNCSLRPFRF